MIPAIGCRVCCSTRPGVKMKEVRGAPAPLFTPPTIVVTIWFAVSGFTTCASTSPGKPVNTVGEYLFHLPVLPERLDIRKVARP